FLDLPAEREAIIAVQGSLAVFVDDTEVVTRDTAMWGIWPRFGVRVRLTPGRHRVLAKVGAPDTSIRVLASNGTPLVQDETPTKKDAAPQATAPSGRVESSADPGPPYAITPPERLPDPNPLEPFLVALGVPPQPGVPKKGVSVDAGDPIERFF